MSFCAKGSPILVLMRRLAFILLLSAALGTAAHSQIINAASCSSLDVQTAFNSITASTTTVNIPSCPNGVAWTSPVTLTVPSGSTTLTIAGQTTCTGTYGAPCTDNTVIIDNTNHNTCSCSLMQIMTGSASSIFRVTGLTIEQNASSNGNDNGIININGKTQNFRWDHSHFLLSSAVSASSAVAVQDDWMYGVWDHNQFDLVQGSVNNGVRVGESNFGGHQNGHGSWNGATPWGASAAIFFENNTYNYAFANDCNNGGRQVYRYNAINYSAIQSHEGTVRGCRSAEIYGNTITGGTPNTNNVGYYLRMGGAYVWNNTVSGIGNMIEFHYDRSEGPSCGHPQSLPPNGFGYCGTTYGPSNWDQNTTSNGYACLDQAGRGNGDLLQGYFPNVCDVTSGQCAVPNYNGSWSSEILEPVYEWMNTYSGVTNVEATGSCSDGTLFQQNRDFYLYTSSFTGASGTGSGLLTARPSTCTTGVAYWATDTSTLYQCSAKNTWSVYYTPYTYPHPLTQGSGPLAPQNLVASVN